MTKSLLTNYGSSHRTSEGPSEGRASPRHDAVGRNSSASAKAVIFDMDGVLIDSMDIQWNAWVEVFREIGIEVDRNDFSRTPGRTAAPVIKLLGRRDFSDKEVGELARKQEMSIQHLMREHVPIMPGVEELIHALQGAGWKMAVGTSGPKENIELVLQTLSGAEFIAECITANDVERGKPDPEIFLKASGRLGVPPTRSVVIEDSVTGLRAARAGGFKSIALTSTFSGEILSPFADMVVESLHDLSPRTIEGLLE